MSREPAFPTVLASADVRAILALRQACALGLALGLGQPAAEHVINTQAEAAEELSVTLSVRLSDAGDESQLTPASGSRRAHAPMGVLEVSVKFDKLKRGDVKNALVKAARALDASSLGFAAAEADGDKSSLIVGDHRTPKLSLGSHCWSCTLPSHGTQ